MAVGVWILEKTIPPRIRRPWGFSKVLCLCHYQKNLKICRTLGLSLRKKAQISSDSGIVRRACLSSEMPQTWPGRSMQTVKVSSQGEQWLSVQRRWSAVKIERAQTSHLFGWGLDHEVTKLRETSAGERGKPSSLHPAHFLWPAIPTEMRLLSQLSHDTLLGAVSPSTQENQGTTDIHTQQKDKAKYLRHDYTQHQR